MLFIIKGKLIRVIENYFLIINLVKIRKFVVFYGEGVREYVFLYFIYGNVS